MELFYQELEKTTKTGCWKYDLQTKELFWSNQTYTIHAVEPGSKIDVETAINFYHPGDKKRIQTLFDALIKEKKEFREHFRIIDKDGILKFVESYGKPILVDGEVSAVFGTFRDVSQEVSLIKSKNMIKSSFINQKENLDKFFIITETDAKGKITQVNKNFCKISKYKPEEVIGKTHYIINSGTHPKDFFKNLWLKISSGEIWSGQICNQDKEGSLYWVETYIFPIRNIENKITGYSSIRYDITDKKMIEDELINEKNKVTFSAQLAAVGEISAGIAHEIANPLSIIDGSTNLIKKGLRKNKDVSKFISSIEKSTMRINKIIKGLHHLSQKSRGDEFEDIKLNTILSNTLEFCAEALKSKDIKLLYDLPKEDMVIFCNETKISQVLLNLINNAKDSIVESNSQEKWIKIQIQEDYEQLYINIVDSGPGINDENKTKINESFFTTKPIGKGTGLGLSLVNQFIKEHHGDFFLNETFENTCFTIVLPKRLSEVA
jgi:PAS domain S-box-containing protein